MQGSKEDKSPKKYVLKDYTVLGFTRGKHEDNKVNGKSYGSFQNGSLLNRIFSLIAIFDIS